MNPQFQHHESASGGWPAIDSPGVDAYLPFVWQSALWGLVGAGANIGVVFLEASRRVKGWPWARPKGPGGGVYAVSVMVNLGIAAGAAAALSTTGMVVNGMVAFGIGAGGPIVVKKVARYVESLLPETDTEPAPQVSRGDEDAA